MEQTKRYVLLGSTILSLIGLLLYNLVHTGGALAKYVHPFQVGYIAAGGIELAVVSMSIRIGEIRKAGKSDRTLWLVLVAVLLVSTLANVSEGFHVAYGEQLTLATVQQLDWMQGLIGFACTGLISLVVFALAEIIAADVDTVTREIVKEQRRAARSDTGKVSSTEANGQPAVLVTGHPAMPIDEAREAKALQDTMDQEARERHIYQLIREGADTPNWSQLARELGISRTTIYSDRDRLIDRGVIREEDGRWVTVNGFTAGVEAS